MPKLTPAQHKELLRLLKEQEKIDAKITQGTKIQQRTADAYEKNLKRINALKKIAVTLTDDQRDAEKEIKNTITKLEKEQRKLNVSGDKYKDLKIKTLNVAKEVLAAGKDNIHNEQISNKLLVDQAQLVSDILIGATDLDSLRDIENEQLAERNKAEEDGLELLVALYNLHLKLIDVKKKELEETEDANDALKFGDDLLGGFVSKGMDFMKKSPLAQGIAAALVIQNLLNAALEQHAKIVDEIGMRLGAGMTGDFAGTLGLATAHAKILGYEASDVLDIFTKLNSQFGFTTDESQALVNEVTDLARIIGGSVDEAAELVGIFSKLTGASTDQAIQLAKQTVTLAKISKVAPSVVMKDIADNTEYFAKYSKDAGKNIAQTAVEARKLGLALSSVEKISDSLLDFQSSLQAEYEASAMMGRRLNLQKARELAMAGDHVGMLKEVTKQVGSQAELEKMTRFERVALAKAVGLEAKELSVLIANQEKARDITRDISEMSFKELVGKDALSGLTLFKNSLQTIGAILVQNFIPPIAFVLGLFGKLVGWLAESKAGMVVLSTVAGGLATVFGVLAYKSIAAAIGMIYKAVGLQAITSGGWMLAAGAGIAVGTIAGMYSALAKAPKLAGGAKVTASPGGSMVNVAEGGKDELITPMDKLGSLVNVDTTAVASEVSVLKGEMKETNSFLSQLLSAMDSYFGVGGTAAKNIGRETIKAISD